MRRHQVLTRLKGREYTAEAKGTGHGSYLPWKQDPEVLKNIQIVIENRDSGYNRRAHKVGVWKVKALKLHLPPVR